jgi:hypothetical protein
MRLTILRCVLAASILLAGCNRQPSATVFIDPALGPLVPADTIMMAGIRMKQIVDTPFYRKHIVGQQVEFIEEFKKQTGLDPTKDFWEILFTSDGKESLVMMRGRFSEHGLEPKINKEGFQRLGYKGYTLLGNERNAVVFLNPSVGVAGSTSGLRRMIDRRDAGGGIPAVLQERISRIPSTHQIWFAASVAGRLPDLGQNDSAMWGNAARLAQTVQFASGGIDVSFGFRASAVLETTSEEDARRIRDTLRGLVGIGRLTTSRERPELVRLYDSIAIGLDGKNTTAKADVPSDLVDEAMALAQKAQK